MEVLAIGRLAAHAIEIKRLLEDLLGDLEVEITDSSILARWDEASEEKRRELLDLMAMQALSSAAEQGL